jgi:hypothetical protein
MKLGNSPKNKAETKELKLVFDDWVTRPGLNVLSKDLASFNNT